MLGIPVIPDNIGILWIGEIHDMLGILVIFVFPMSDLIQSYFLCPVVVCGLLVSISCWAHCYLHFLSPVWSLIFAF